MPTRQQIKETIYLLIAMVIVAAVLYTLFRIFAWLAAAAL